MADEGRMFEIAMAELRGNSPSNQRVIDALDVLRSTDVTMMLTNGDVLGVQLLGPSIRSKCGYWVSYEFNSTLTQILRDNQIFARHEMEILHGFSTKFGIALYEIISKRVWLKHIFYTYFEIDEFRDYLGVPVDASALSGALPLGGPNLETVSKNSTPKNSTPWPAERLPPEVRPPTQALPLFSSRCSLSSPPRSRPGFISQPA